MLSIYWLGGNFFSEFNATVSIYVPAGPLHSDRESIEDLPQDLPAEILYDKELLWVHTALIKISAMI